jgi:hypothetical protein
MTPRLGARIDTGSIGVSNISTFLHMTVRRILLTSESKRRDNMNESDAEENWVENES